MNRYQHSKEGDNLPEIPVEDVDLPMSDSIKGATGQSTTRDLATGTSTSIQGVHPNPPVGVSEENLLQGHFPNTMTTQDFVNFTSYEPWGDQEVMKLLEAAQMYQHDWDAIAAHVGKDRDECILKYLDLPGKPTEEGSAVGTTPDHPILALVSYLSTQVDGELAKVAAKAVRQETDSDSQVLGSTALALVSAQAKVESGKATDRLASLTLQYVDLLCLRVQEKLKYVEQLQQQMTTERRSAMTVFSGLLKERFMEVDLEDVEMGEEVAL